MPDRELARQVDAALADAHLPALLVTLVHLTGDERLLKEAWRPKYVPYADNRAGGLSTDAQSDLKAAAREILLARLGGDAKPALADIAADLLQRMMDFVAGARVPAHYLPLLRAELGLDASARSQAMLTAPASKAANFKAVIIGAGMSGILAAIRLKQAGVAFELIERNRDVGGTWFENDYPGCRVDSQNHIYSYSFVPNYDWPQHFSTQEVLLRYFQDCVKRFGIAEHLRLNTSVEWARLDEASGRWHLRLTRPDGTTEDIVADAVISAVGQLNKPNIPDYEGRERFKGPQFHSARWDHSVDLGNKHVAVIGTGASSYQFAPLVAEEAAHLDVYQRSAPWMAPSPDYHFDVGEGQKWLLHNLPGYAQWYRFWLFWTITDGVYNAVKRDPDWDASDGSISAANRAIRDTLVGRMKAQIGDRADLIDKVVPNYPFGGKRTLRDSGQWIPMLKRDNVDLVTNPIERITEDTIITADGTEHPTDVIIYGTGFHASRFLEPLRIVGKGGVELTDMWNGDARAYLGMTVPGFPNFFCIYGPNTNLVVNGSIVFFSECSMDYILGCIDLLLTKNVAGMEPKAVVHDAFNARVDDGNRQMAWGLDGVHNWYKNASGRVTQNWPFPLVEYWQATRKPNPDDFVFTPKAG